jgi:predicted amidohydrolase
MAKPLRVATVQFENFSGDKQKNLDIIARLAAKASASGCDVVSFHECCITGYTYLRGLSRQELTSVAEPVPSGPSTQSLVQISREHNIFLLAGLVEHDPDEDKLYNTYICVGPSGFIAAHRKIHPFINTHLSSGNSYTTFSIKDWTCGILICYDNNVIENVRATALLGAQILFSPHVTMCTPSPRPGAGFVSPSLWANREADPTSLRAEFDSLKGRGWLMKWLPARAFDNGIYVVFSNPIGMDGDQLKPGCATIVDPFGDVVAESRALGEDVVHALCTAEKLVNAGGNRYRAARRPELYGDVISRGHKSEQKVGWIDGQEGKQTAAE